MQCANSVSTANWNYNENGLYEHVRVPSLTTDLAAAKWQRVDVGIVSRVRQLPNEIFLAQSVIDGGWTVDPGDETLKRSLREVARCGWRAWCIAVELRKRYALPRVDLRRLSWNFVEDLREYGSDELDRPKSHLRR